MHSHAILVKIFLSCIVVTCHVHPKSHETLVRLKERGFLRYRTKSSCRRFAFINTSYTSDYITNRTQ